MSFDVIIVGSGATGSWAAKLLTESGLTVLLLEAGPPFAAVASGPTANGASDPVRQPVQAQCYAFNAETRHLFVDDIDNPYETHSETPFAWIRMRLVGGRTRLWHRVVLRMSDRQFKAASRDGFGVDWPISYADLQPYYDRVERFLGVSGIVAHLEEVPDGPFVPVALSAAAREFQQAVEIEWPGRRVTALRRASCVSGVGSYPACSAGVALADAEATSRLTLRPHSVVSNILSGRDGRRAQGVEYVDCKSGVSHEAYGRAVVLCASTIETTRILLNSTSHWHPGGIGNCNGLLGRYLSDHICGVSATGLRSGECGAASDFYVPNFRNLGGDGAAFLRGYGVQGYFTPMRGAVTECTLVCFGEMLTRPENTVTLSRQRDRWGIPAAHLECHLSANEIAMAEDQASEVAQMLRRTGFELTTTTGLRPLGCSMHEMGTARMGADPRSSILNSYNQCWEMPNLFVTDGAAFPSTGFQNPTLTMMALTGRACDYLVGEFRRGAW